MGEKKSTVAFAQDLAPAFGCCSASLSLSGWSRFVHDGRVRQIALKILGQIILKVIGDTPALDLTHDNEQDCIRNAQVSPS